MTMPELPGDPPAPPMEPQVRDGDDLALADAEARPAVQKRKSPFSTAAVFACIAMMGIVLFSWMNANRARREATVRLETAQFSADEPPVQLLQLTTEPRAGYGIPGPQFNTANVSPEASGPAPNFPLPAVVLPGDAAQRLRAPVLVVDLGPGVAAPSAAIANPALGAAINPLAKGASALGAGETDATATGGGSQISAEERFAERIGGQEAERVRATQLHSLDRLIPQGAVIPAVLETALNSDLPGFTRAVVSRDVRSFDGSTVLIPRGSRLIGQYKSGVALGQSRVFVIWQRVIRPDGVSVQIGSPVTDTLGRGGLEGKVDNHFFTRFGGSILLSVLNAGLNYLSNRATSSTSQIFIGSPAEASNVAALALQKDSGRSPTIQTPQGTPIQIFVARDLDFSDVTEGAKP